MPVLCAVGSNRLGSNSSGGKSYTVTAESIVKGCPFAGACNLEEKLCLPLYTVVQAIINLANPAGSTEFEILSQTPIVCTSLAVGPFQVQNALEEGLRRRVLCLNVQSDLQRRYRVNINMADNPANEDLYNCFKSQLFCGAQCVPCPCPCASYPLPSC